MDLSIGNRIATRRKELGITGQQIKDSIGISTGNLSGIEKGNSLPSATALMGLSKILHCSTDWILTGETPISEFSCNSLSEREVELITTYRKLDTRGKRLILAMINEELILESHVED